MALMKCSECGQHISSQATACPHCGNPISAKKASKAGGIGCLVAIALIGGLIAIGSSEDSTKKAKEAANPTCVSNWHLCKDSADFVDHFNGKMGDHDDWDWNGIGIQCKDAAEAEARYGSPVWPSMSFGHYHAGDDYVRSGVAVAFEPDAQFQNGFGAMVHSHVTCQYDLSAGKVLNVDVDQKVAENAED
jgi:DNA-directed RNA polymerase subunit RPC12/RpoP